MKKTLLVLFICTITALKAQKHYNCYHIQEFMLNPSTNQYDTPKERSDASQFTMDDKKMLLTQRFDDGTSSSLPVKAIKTDPKTSNTSYDVISPANGSTYIYRVNQDASVIEVLLARNNGEILLKKYLFK